LGNSLMMGDWLSRENESRAAKLPRKMTFQASGNMTVSVPCIDRPLLKMAQDEKGPELSLRELSDLTLIDAHQRRLVEMLLGEGRLR
jgi:hypothetical protein